MKTKVLASAFALVLFTTAQVNAAVVVSVELVNPGTVYPGFVSPTSNPLADSITGTVFQNVSGTVQDVRRSPFDDPAGNPTLASAANLYTSVQAGGSARWNFSGGTLGIAFLWGSPDYFNKVEFFNGTTSVGFVTGADLTNPNRNPPQNSATGQSWVVILPGAPWTSAVFSSTINAFEFTSLRPACTAEAGNGVPPPEGFPRCGFAEATPLPAALPLFVTGFGALELFGWQRKKKAVARAA